MRNLARIVLYSTAAFLCGACTPTLVTQLSWGAEARPGITEVVFSDDMIPFTRFWTVEVQRRHPNAVVVFSHGLDVNGAWWCEGYDGPEPVAEMLEGVQARHPDRHVVLVVCNPLGVRLDATGISYAGADIWLVPDRVLSTRSLEAPAVVGNIFEFYEQ